MTEQVAVSPEMSACIELCRRCHLVCLNMATGHCLEKGGGHVGRGHLRAMIACAELCQTAANVMTIGSPLHRQVCALCANACEACITSCRELDEMEECIFACERCKTSCEAMTAH
jgi:hypothetical protein